MERAVRFVIATAVAVAVVVATVVFASQILPGAWTVLHTTDPAAVLRHDRGFMNVPAGATLSYEDGVCDSGQFSRSRHLQVTRAAARTVRARFEAELVRSGWNRGDEPHLFVKKMRDHRRLSVGVVGPDAHGDLAINAGADPAGEFSNC